MPYSLMTMEEIQRLPIGDLAADRAHLFLWVPASLNAAGVGITTAEAWGFKRVGEFVWEKPRLGMGAFPRTCHEILMVCRRGGLGFTGARNVRSVQRWSVAGRLHSKKPEAAMDLIEQVSPGPYLELFSRRHRLGWDVWGDQVGSTIEMGNL